MTIPFEDCDHKNSAKAPMDSLVWFCGECGATIDFSYDDNLYVASFKDGRPNVIVPKPKYVDALGADHGSIEVEPIVLPRMREANLGNSCYLGRCPQIGKCEPLGQCWYSP